MFAPLVAAAVLLTALAPQSRARRSNCCARDEPEVVVQAGGRVGTADAVQFGPRGAFLLAAGDDKVVHVWPHSAAGLDTSPRAHSIMRWRSWRDQLGGIKALAVSPDGKRVAVGGYGLRVSTVAILDRASGETVALTWPRVRDGDHYDAVMAVAFDAGGQRVGFGTADGTLWLWKPERLPKPVDDRTWTAPVRVGKFEPLKDTDFNFPRNVRFADDNTLVGVAQSGEVLACDLGREFTDDPAATTPAGTRLFDTSMGLKLRYRLDKAAWTGDGKWLVATTDVNLVIIRSADGKRRSSLELPEDHFARSLAVHPRSGRLAIGVTRVHPAIPGHPRFYTELDDEVWVYDNATAGDVVVTMKYKHDGRAEGLAFHPTENQLAIAGGDADQITLLDLARPETPVSVARGLGRRLHAIRLSESGELFAVQTGRNAASTDPNDRGRGDWVRFNLTRFTTTAGDVGNWLGPVATDRGWRIAPSKSSRFVWYARTDQAEYRLALDPDIDQAPTCYTFVPTPPEQPPRVLVGHYYGCSLFVLDPERAIVNPKTGKREFERAKLFIGHGAEVNAIVADKTGTWFVTAGADQTVSAWSLADWKSQPTLGAAFAVEGGSVVVTAVDPGSPAWEAGLSKGDRIDRLGVHGEYVYDRREGSTAVGTQEAAAAALARPRSGVELVFWWKPGGRGDYRISPTRLKQRPLWKWFPAFDDQGQPTDSVLWMWHGSYYMTRSANGDRFVGWHVNHRDVVGTPRFYTLERYKHLFFRDDVIAKLIATRSVAEALKLAEGGDPRKKTFNEVEPDPVVLSVKQAEVPHEGVGVTVAVNPSGNNPDLLPERVELWVNDYRHRVWQTAGNARFRQELTIPAAVFRAGDNQITVLAVNPARGRAEAEARVHNPAALDAPALHGLMSGIDDYSAHRRSVGGERGAFADLSRAGADVKALRDGLLKYTGKDRQFPAGNVTVLVNADATRQGLTAALANLRAARVKPNDLLVVFFAGHGDLLDSKGKPLPPAPEGLAARGWPGESGRFVFCCPDYTPANASTTALAGDELFDALADINCRKLVLLDACHSGGAAEANLLRKLIPNGQGPVVIAACAQSEQSYEDDALGHGAFTFAVLEALGTKFRVADRDSDGAVSTSELYTYLASRVPELVREAKPGKTQNPICFPHPSALPKVALVKR